MPMNLLAAAFGGKQYGGVAPASSNQRWVTPSDDDILKMMTQVEQETFADDQKWLNTARSVVDQQNAYAAYQKAMNAAGAVKHGDQGWQSFAQWSLGDNYKAPASVTPPAPRPPAPSTARTEGSVMSGTTAGKGLSDGSEVGSLNNISSHVLRSLLDGNRITPRNRQAVEEELGLRESGVKFPVDPTLATQVHRHTEALTEELALDYMKQMLEMEPKDRRKFLRENLGPSLFDSAPLLFNAARKAYNRPGLVGLSGDLDSIHKVSALFRDMQSLHTALRSDSEAGTTGAVFGRLIDTLSWGLTDEETSEAIKLFREDKVTEQDVAEWYQVMAANLGEVAGYAIMASVLGSLGSSASAGAGKIATVAPKAHEVMKKFMGRFGGKAHLTKRPLLTNRPHRPLLTNTPPAGPSNLPALKAPVARPIPLHAPELPPTALKATVSPGLKIYKSVVNNPKAALTMLESKGAFKELKLKTVQKKKIAQALYDRGLEFGKIAEARQYISKNLDALLNHTTGTAGAAGATAALSAMLPFVDVDSLSKEGTDVLEELVKIFGAE